jgi:4-deoxy-L-threo-5-hexosulose-uronate ketol-isomerase
MEVRFLPDPATTRRMTTQELRERFVFDRIAVPGEIRTVYVDADRSIIGFAIPTTAPLDLTASRTEMAADHFLERREMGIVNVGGAGVVIADGKEFVLAKRDMVYLGRGTKAVSFKSANGSNPAAFFFVSYPAHREYPSRLMTFAESAATPLGTPRDANKRTIHKYIHEAGIPSCQLVMGMTVLEEGSVWNTMPAHTHLRRSEVYMYFDVPEDGMVVHLMGEPTETRHVILHNRQAVISPVWSIHAGAATQAYSFIWAMGGENQAFDDMDKVAVRDLK